MENEKNILREETSKKNVQEKDVKRKTTKEQEENSKLGTPRITKHFQVDEKVRREEEDLTQSAPA